MDLGKRVKQLRVKNGLTLEELASRTELTKSFLSQLERNLTTPSIPTLENIVEVLGVSLGEFFQEERSVQRTFTEQDYFEDEKELMKITYLVPNRQQNDMEPLLLTIEPEGMSRTVLPHDGEEMGYILQGKIVLKDLTNNTSNTLKKGETFYIKGDFRHCLVNEGNSVAKVLWVSTPPAF
ncbi:MAG: helix-turn-helix domain-containing protein [Erysipelotrichaceae bacterium]|nr:helix-turn-helix domain-containing protein [Erysipelotrichaceae bacterium]